MNKALKCVALVDDICGFGKCSLTIAIPTLSAAKIEVCSAASSIYTTHTPISGYKKLETDPILEDTIEAWRNLKLNFDAIYTGSLSNKNQAYLCMQLFANQKNALKITDPVLGDFGKFYDKNFKALLPHVYKLCSHADIITPNITEAQFLTGINTEDPEKLISALTKIVPKTIILKGFVESNKITNYLYSNGKISLHSATFYDHTIHGAGDFFISCILAHYLAFKDLQNSVDFATKIVSDAVKFTISQQGFENKGIIFEPFLKQLANF